MKSLLFLGLILLSFTTTSADQKWASFAKLTNSHQGQSPPGLSAVKEYLKQFGYLSTKSATFDNKFDATFHSALLTYQKFFNLKNSGVLDATTVNQMMEPRCGMPDIVTENTTANGRNLYAVGGNPWPPGSKLKYYFTSTGTTIRKRRVARIIRGAFNRWSNVANVLFKRVFIENQADIVIGFFSEDHGDGSPFDGQFGVLAHAALPQGGFTHFDSDEIWAPNLRFLARTTGSVDLLTVAIHEFGHNLGLRHSNVQNAIMWPSVQLQTRKATLDADDIEGIQFLYGSK